MLVFGFRMIESYWPDFFDESHFREVNASLKYMDCRIADRITGRNTTSRFETVQHHSLTLVLQPCFSPSTRRCHLRTGMDRSIEIETPAGVDMATSDGTIAGKTGGVTGGLGRTRLSDRAT